ncbi:MAG: hypothetical protein NT084_02350 [Bacteroidetes bacterium]|nr:hypothetical protein [Bacteroidota bacterium]
MKKIFLVFISLFLVSFAFSQVDSTNTKIYRNDTLAARLNQSLAKITIDKENYFLKCAFTHATPSHGIRKPYYWNIFLRTTHVSVIPENIKPLKLFIITDTLIYEYSYLPNAHCWSKTSDLYEKPLSVVVEFVDIKTNRKYFVKAKGPFVTKH